jgi:hypothetical protein
VTILALMKKVLAEIAHHDCFYAQCFGQYHLGAKHLLSCGLSQLPAK